MNVSKCMRLASQLKSVNRKPVRMFSSEINNYFKRVLKHETPSKETPFSVERDIEINLQHAELKRQKLEEISKRNEYREILGMKDYQLKDYKLQGALNDTPDYKGIITGKIPQDKIEANRYELEIVSNLNPRHEIAVFNLPYDVTKEEILTIFDKHGFVNSVELNQKD